MHASCPLPHSLQQERGAARRKDSSSDLTRSSYMPGLSAASREHANAAERAGGSHLAGTDLGGRVHADRPEQMAQRSPLQSHMGAAHGLGMSQTCMYARNVRLSCAPFACSYVSVFTRL
jgi:hypothetical protein